MRAIAGAAAVVLATAASVAGVSAADAAPRALSGAANQGSVTGEFGDGPTDTGPLARCTVTGTTHAHQEPRTIGNSTRFGSGDSTCTRSNGTVVTRAASAFGAIDTIRDFSGVGLQLHDYAARCTATAHSASARVAVGSVYAGGRVRLPEVDTLPNPIPKNYRVNVTPYLPPGPSETLVFNEQVPNGRGGVTVSVVHFMQYGGGDIYLGRADCAPLG